MPSPSGGLAVSIADLEAAAARIGVHVLRTPLVPLEHLGLHAKCESLQRTGAFKLRGASNAVLALRPRGVVTASSGNHAQALALAGRDAGIPVTVVMPDDASAHKRAATAALGARIVDSSPATSERNRVAAELAADQGLTYISAYDDALVIAGQGTCGLEIAEQAPEAAAVVVPLGGGGLLGGIAVALRSRGRSRLRIVGVEPEDGDDTVRSLGAGGRVSVAPPRTICDGARTQIPGELTFPIIAALVDEVVSVSDAAVVEAMRELARAGLIVEPTGALAVAGAIALRLQGAVCVLSGRNIDPAEHARLLGEPPSR